MKIDLEEEKKEILRRYRGLLRAAKNSRLREDRKAIRKAFDLALDLHSDQRRKSGEPYIYHPIGVVFYYYSYLSSDLLVTKKSLNDIEKAYPSGWAFFMVDILIIQV